MMHYVKYDLLLDLVIVWWAAFPFLMLWLVQRRCNERHN